MEKPLPPSAERCAPAAAIAAGVTELERLCGDLDAGFAAGDWTAFANALRESRRATYALRDAIAAAGGLDEATRTRARRVFDRRRDLLERLETFHAGVRTRLQTLSKWKLLARSIGARHAPQLRAGFDTTQ